MLSSSRSLHAESRRCLRKIPVTIVIIFLLILALTCKTVKPTYNDATQIHTSASWSSDSPIFQPKAAKPTPKSRVGKVHAVFGEQNSVYERALALHRSHSELMGHPMFVLRERLLSGLWSKPAFILSIMLQELAKPEEERLAWLLWIDADIVVMNPQISLDLFIPPSPEFSYVNLLATNDRHGLNNGCFLIRVNAWAVKLLTATIAFHTFRPEVKLQYSEQSALEEMIEDSYYRRSVVRVPQYWFNAYPASTENEGVVLPPHEFREGGLQIHFAGNRDGKRPERMNTWMDIAEEQRAPYNVPVNQVSLVDDIHEFWANLSEKRTKKGIPMIIDALQ